MSALGLAGTHTQSVLTGETTGRADVGRLPAGRELMEEFLRRVFTASTVADAAQAAVDSLRTALGADLGWCGLLQDGVLRMAAHSGLRTSRMATTWQLPLGEGVGGRVAAEGRAIAVRDYRYDPRRAPNQKSLIDDERVRSAVCAPVVHGSQVLGVLYAASRSVHEWPEGSIDLAVMNARDLGSALHRIRIADHGARVRDRHRASIEIADALVGDSDLSRAVAIFARSLDRSVEVTAPTGAMLARAGRADAQDVRFETAPGPDPVGAMRVLGGPELDSAEREYAELVSRLVAMHFLAAQAGLRSELRVYGEFLDDLLEGRAEGLSTRGALLGVDLAQPHAVACIGGAEALDSAGLARIRDRVLAAFPHSAVIPRDGIAVVLVRYGSGPFPAVVDALRRIVGTPPAFTAGLGRRCERLDDYADSYAEASLALDLALSRRAEGSVLVARDLGLYGLLVRGSTRDTIVAMVDRALRPLLAADAGGGPEYVKTLRAYFTHDRHLERTAAALHVHANTLRYRLTRVQELLSINLRDPDDRFMLELAVRAQAALDPE